MVSQNLPTALQAPLKADAEDQEMNEQLRSLHAARQVIIKSPFTSGRLLDNQDANGVPQGYVFTAGETKTIMHGLGRAVNGILPVLPGALFSSGDVTLRHVANPSSDVTPDQGFSIRSANACTCYFWVW